MNYKTTYQLLKNVIYILLFFIITMVITIIKTIGKVGHSYYVRIPKAFINEGLLQEGKKYKILIEEAEKRENKELEEAEIISRL